MLTEQEVLAHLNERGVSLKPTTMRYVEKIRNLNKILSDQQKDLQELSQKVDNYKTEIARTRGAISILLEIAAEEEGLLTLNNSQDSQENQ